MDSLRSTSLVRMFLGTLKALPRHLRMLLWALVSLSTLMAHVPEDLYGPEGPHGPLDLMFLRAFMVLRTFVVSYVPENL